MSQVEEVKVGTTTSKPPMCGYHPEPCPNVAEFMVMGQSVVACAQHVGLMLSSSPGQAPVWTIVAYGTQLTLDAEGFDVT